MVHADVAHRGNRNRTATHRLTQHREATEQGRRTHPKHTPTGGKTQTAEHLKTRWITVTESKDRIQKTTTTEKLNYKKGKKQSEIQHKHNNTKTQWSAKVRLPVIHQELREIFLLWSFCLKLMGLLFSFSICKFRVFFFRACCVILMSG